MQNGLLFLLKATWIILEKIKLKIMMQAKITKEPIVFSKTFLNTGILLTLDTQ